MNTVNTINILDFLSGLHYFSSQGHETATTRPTNIHYTCVSLSKDILFSRMSQEFKLFSDACHERWYKCLSVSWIELIKIQFPGDLNLAEFVIEFKFSWFVSRIWQ